VLRQASEVLGRDQRVVVFTGAGISAESGVPTFRDDLTGLWARYDPETLATPEAFDADPDLVWGWYEWRRGRVMQVDPNAGHRAVAMIGQRAPHCCLVTQNVDDLHERAGATDPIHLHGSLFAPRCIVCSRSAPVPEQVQQPPEGARLAPPSCADCGGLIRPGVVWFGESLPEQALNAAIEAASVCDVLLTVGTSGVVYPAAEIPMVAARSGATVIQVNPQPTPLDAIAAVNLRGTAATLLPELVVAAYG
jgi:NAD-dependent deacetylase